MATKKGDRNSKELDKENQQEIEEIVRHGMGTKSNKLICLLIKWVGYEKSIIEQIKTISLTVPDLVAAYKSKNTLKM